MEAIARKKNWRVENVCKGESLGKKRLSLAPVLLQPCGVALHMGT